MAERKSASDEQTAQEAGSPTGDGPAPPFSFPPETAGTRGTAAGPRSGLWNMADPGPAAIFVVDAVSGPRYGHSPRFHYILWLVV